MTDICLCMDSTSLLGVVKYACDVMFLRRMTHFVKFYATFYKNVRHNRTVRGKNRSLGLKSIKLIGHFKIVYVFVR